MSFRSLVIVNLSKNDHGKILLYRYFPTAEKRCQNLYGNKYVPLPFPQLFIDNLLVTLGISTDSKQFVKGRDDAGRCMQLPVFELAINGKELWPIIAVTQGSCLACCLPIVENYSNIDKSDLLKIAPISVGFSLLLGILNYANSIMILDNNQVKLAEMESYITLVLPFGTPSDIEFSYASHIHRFHLTRLQKKQPAWKPIDYKGKQQISLKIMECVRSVQNKHSGNHCELFGQIYVRADLEGAVNEIMVALIPPNIDHPLLLESVVIHPCVTIHGGSAMSSSSLPKRIRFTPPLHEFILLQYCLMMPKEPPILGVFKMLGESSVELSIQLKLNERVKNNFDFCDVIIVFFNRGPVKNMDINSSHGTTKLLDDKYTMKWSLGSKFPKELETVLTAKLDFFDGPILTKSDPFCIDQNSYVQINFKQSSYTLSGFNIDPKSVIVPEGSKPKIVIERSVQSAEYRLWNNYGDLPFPTQLVKKSETIFL